MWRTAHRLFFLFVLVSDEEDRLVLQKRLPNDLGQIREALEPHRAKLAGVVITPAQRSACKKSTADAIVRKAFSRRTQATTHQRGDRVLGPTVDPQSSRSCRRLDAIRGAPQRVAGLDHRNISSGRALLRPPCGDCLRRYPRSRRGRARTIRLMLRNEKLRSLGSGVCVTRMPVDED